MDNQTPPERDRITLAWELRRDIHDWIKANPYCVMVEIFRAFPDRKRETVRKAVIRMRTDGDVAMVGRRKTMNEGIYATVTTQIKSEQKKREALATGARKNQHLAAAASRKPITQKHQKHLKTKAGKAEQAAADQAVREPWITPNTDPDRPVTRNPDPIRGTGWRGMTQLEASV